MAYGNCIQCNDIGFEDIEAHKAQTHKGRKVLDNEIYSGAMDCKRCRNVVLTPRGKKWEEVPLHKADPAIAIKNEQGFVVGYRNANGMDASNFQLTITPEPEALSEGKTGCVSP